MMQNSNLWQYMLEIGNQKQMMEQKPKLARTLRVLVEFIRVARIILMWICNDSTLVHEYTTIFAAFLLGHLCTF